MSADDPALSETKLLACRASRGKVAFADCSQAVARIKRHQAALVSGKAVNPLLDIALARTIAAALSTALADLDRLDQPRHEWLLTAASYFCEHADRFHDVDDLIGLDDDAQVVAVILDHCGLVHLAQLIRTASS
jgi:hypothetical protein